MKNRETFYLTPEELNICRKYGIERKQLKQIIHNSLKALEEKTEA